MSLKNSGLIFVFLLLYLSSFLIPRHDIVSCYNCHGVEKQELVSFPEIQTPEIPLNLAVEINTSGQFITEVHRMASVLILTNRIVPNNFNFRSLNEIPRIINTSTRIPIFILGHVLRH